MKRQQSNVEAEVALSSLRFRLTGNLNGLCRPRVKKAFFY